MSLADAPFHKLRSFGGIGARRRTPSLKKEEEEEKKVFAENFGLFHRTTILNSVAVCPTIGRESFWQTRCFQHLI
jgi:hypothetical protein